jgi:hypothetical protein
MQTCCLVKLLYCRCPLFLMCCFINLLFCQFAVMSTCCVIKLLLSQLAVLPTCSFSYVLFCQLAILSTYNGGAKQPQYMTLKSEARLGNVVYFFSEIIDKMSGCQNAPAPFFMDRKQHIIQIEVFHLIGLM